ncbi:hypothetical protein [Streptomyces sp. NPDC056194]|uniref:hypothetical protein n=1 Tax=unclassified Streptomyces TaxID=2593676 RepID=UPI0035D96562
MSKAFCCVASPTLRSSIDMMKSSMTVGEKLLIRQDSSTGSSWRSSGCSTVRTVPGAKWR